MLIPTVAYWHVPCCVLLAQVIGGGLRDSFLVAGVAFKKTFSYAGFEQQPKAFDSECTIAGDASTTPACLRCISDTLPRTSRPTHVQFLML